MCSLSLYVKRKIYNVKKGGWEEQVSIIDTVPVPLDKKGGRRFHLLLHKRWHLLPPFVTNEPGTG
jgi:hypothetical protein